MSTGELQQIGQIGIPITDLERSISFYENILGLPLLFKALPGLAFFSCGDVRIMLDSSSRENAGHGSVVYYKLDELEAWFSARESMGVTFEREPHLVAKMPDHELWMCFLRDPDGNLIGIMEEKKP